jgi:hypothetical protein
VQESVSGPVLMKTVMATGSTTVNDKTSRDGCGCKETYYYN